MIISGFAIITNFLLDRRNEANKMSGMKVI